MKLKLLLVNIVLSKMRNVSSTFQETKEKQEIVSYTTNGPVDVEKYFHGVSETGVDPKYFNAVMDVTYADLNKLQYFQPTNN